MSNLKASVMAFLWVMTCTVNARAALADLSEAQWCEFEGWVAQIDPAFVHYVVRQAEDPESLRDYRAGLRRLKVELPFSEMKQTFERYGILQLRPKRSSQLLVGCGNYPLEGLGQAGNSVDASDLALPRLERHQHLAWDTIDPSPLQNPTFVAWLGTENFARFIEERGAQYQLIQPEGLNLVRSKNLMRTETPGLLKEQLRQIGRVLIPEGIYKTYHADLLLVDAAAPELLDSVKAGMAELVVTLDLSRFREELAQVVSGSLAGLLELRQWNYSLFLESVQAMSVMRSIRAELLAQLNQGAARFGLRNLRLPENFKEVMIAGLNEDLIGLLWQQVNQGSVPDLRSLKLFEFSYDFVSFQWIRP